MIKSLLIANRGEIACRIIKTAKRMNIRTIAVYSDADAQSMHVKAADIAVHIGASPASESYLCIDKIIKAALDNGAEAIHPGYGFLSEKAEFAKACRDNGIIFVGPSPEAISAMGLKDNAKTIMQKAGVPIVPGYFGANQAAAFLHEQADLITYPVLIKAVAGGGGKGMKRVDHSADFIDALASAKRESKAAFGDDVVMIEKYVQNPRHIEIQVFGDNHGNIVHLFERDCSLQRRHQKVIEEAPAPGMTDDMRNAMGNAAVEAARSVNYSGAGTVEFIVDASDGLRSDRFYFMEMNTRLQVEHPVTEMITGVDLVEWQLRVASNESLPLKQNELSIKGHAVEARLYAEDPDRGFLPSMGKLVEFDAPFFTKARVDTGVKLGDTISPFYDPMIAKVIIHDDTRGQALDKLHTALSEMEVFGVRTNLCFLMSLLRANDFKAGVFDTGFIAANENTLEMRVTKPSDKAIAAAFHTFENGAFYTFGKGAGFSAADSFQLGGARITKKPLLCDGELIMALVPQNQESYDTMFTKDHQGKVYILENGRQYIFEKPNYTASQEVTGGLKAPMHSKVTAVFVTKGQLVKKGDPLLVLEAMKMEHTITAPLEGRVEVLNIAITQQVSEGAVLLEIA
jgi:3-methylcrotonyl-CoA carboxylase alpha subunit